MVIFEVCAYLFEFKEGDPPQADQPPRLNAAGQASIYRIFRGLKFEPDAEIGQKVPFCKGLNLIFYIFLIRCVNKASFSTQRDNK